MQGPVTGVDEYKDFKRLQNHYISLYYQFYFKQQKDYTEIIYLYGSLKIKSLFFF